MSARRVNGAAPKGDPAYRQLWRLVDGAVAMTFDHHPDYLTPKGCQSARTSITKRVTGLVHGYAAEAARSGSGSSPAAATVEGVQIPTPEVVLARHDLDDVLSHTSSPAGGGWIPSADLPIHGWL